MNEGFSSLSRSKGWIGLCWFCRGGAVEVGASAAATLQAHKPKKQKKTSSHLVKGRGVPAEAEAERLEERQRDAVALCLERERRGLELGADLGLRRPRLAGKALRAEVVALEAPAADGEPLPLVCFFVAGGGGGVRAGRRRRRRAALGGEFFSRTTGGCRSLSRARRGRGGRGRSRG